MMELQKRQNDNRKIPDINLEMKHTLMRFLHNYMVCFHNSGINRICEKAETGQIESVIGLRCRQKNPSPRVYFRHYPLSRGLGFLSLHWRPIIDNIFIPVMEKS